MMQERGEKEELFYHHFPTRTPLLIFQARKSEE
jgi:hypothetical protein